MIRTIKLAVIASLALALPLACSEGPTSDRSGTGENVSAPPPIVVEVGWVRDAAEILNASQEAALAETLADLQRSTGHQMVVATVPTLRGQDVAKFTSDLGNRWGIGRKDEDDGVILLVAPNERKTRIAVGRGLERKLPDSLCQQIMTTKMLPRFREGDMGGGIEAGVQALIPHLQ